MPYRSRSILCALLFALLSLVWSRSACEAQTLPGTWIQFASSDSGVTIHADTATIRALIVYLSNLALAGDSAIAAGTGITITSQGTIKVISSTSGISLAQVSATIDSAFSVLGRRLRPSNIEHGTNGQYLVMFGGSPTWISPTWATVSQLADSVAALFGGPRKIPISLVDGAVFSDSVKRLGREFVFHGYFAPSAAADTALGQAFGLRAYGTYQSGRFASGHTDVPLIVKSIVVSHVWDSTFSTYNHRDTVVTFSDRDSIPAGASIWFAYRPAQAAFQYIQAVRPIYTPINGSTGYYAGEQVQVPLLLGVPIYNRGIRHATHAVSVTLKCVEKVPGRIY